MSKETVFTDLIHEHPSAIVPVCSKISSNKNIFEKGLKTEQVVVITITALITIALSLWAYKGYQRLTLSAQELLKDLE